MIPLGFSQNENILYYEIVLQLCLEVGLSIVYFTRQLCVQCMHY